MKAFFTILTVFFFLPMVAQRPGSCGIKNIAFKSGESVKFSVYYTLAGIYVHAGNVNFTTNLSSYNGKPVYHIVGTGVTVPSYDWIYRVRDRYETFIDTSTLLPYRFLRNVDEGGYKINQAVTFDQEKRIAISGKTVTPLPECVQDVLSEVYFARNLDFERMKPGTQIPFSLYLDEEVNSMYIRYLGKEVIKTRYGRFLCYKFRPLLLKGSIFDGGEKMTVWVSADNNRLPVRIESPIIVGSIKVDMMGYSGLRNPLTSLISLK